MLKSPLFFLSCLFIFSCATTATKLTEIDPGMTQEQVRSILGNPESVSLAFKDHSGANIKVLDYRLYQYSGAIDGLSPYFDIYSFIFIDNELVKWVKSKPGTRLSEDAALRLIGK